MIFKGLILKIEGLSINIAPKLKGKTWQSIKGEVSHQSSYYFYTQYKDGKN